MGLVKAWCGLFVMRAEGGEGWRRAYGRREGYTRMTWCDVCREPRWMGRL